MRHYAARNLLDSTGILVLGSQTMGPAGEERLGRPGRPRLLTSGQRPSPTPTRHIFRAESLETPDASPT